MAYQPRTPMVNFSSGHLGNRRMMMNGHPVGGTTLTPSSTGSSSNTFLMPVSPLRGRRASGDGYSPKVSRTTGQRPACLVNASVTYCGDNQIYAFGGFDQYTDEGASPDGRRRRHAEVITAMEIANLCLVYNHVLKLDLGNLQWSLVDNYGDIPGVRMGTYLIRVDDLLLLPN